MEDKLGSDGKKIQVVDLTGKPEHPAVTKAFEEAKVAASPLSAIRENLNALAQETQKIQTKVENPSAETRTDDFVDLTHSTATRTDDKILSEPYPIGPRNK